jgi:hypothetical protein
MEKVQPRRPDEIQRAHDLLAHVTVAGIAIEQLDPELLKAAACYGAVLCWVLGHDHNRGFALVIQSIDALLEAHGLVYDGATRRIRLAVPHG